MVITKTIVSLYQQNEKAMSNLSIYINECAAIKQMYELGLINDVERQIQLIRAKALYITQKKDSQ